MDNRSAKVVVLRGEDYQKLMALFGGLGEDGRGGAQNLLLICWETLEEAGWSRTPDTVEEIQHRAEHFQFSPLARRVETVFSPESSLLKDPIHQTAERWKVEAQEVIETKPVTLTDLLPYDKNLD